MRTMIEIALCMFAVYGIYSAIIELCACLSRWAHVVYAIRTDECGSTAELSRTVCAVSAQALRDRRSQSECVLLCEDGSLARALTALGYEVYVRCDGTEWQKTG